MEYRLIECLEKIVDNRGRNPQYYNVEKYPIIDNVNIKNNFYINVKEVNRYIDEETFKNFLRGYVEKNMPIMTLVGSGIGNVALVPTEESAIVQNTIGFKVRKKILNNIYLYYWFLIKQQELKKFNRGSGQPSIKKTDIENMIIDLPEIDIQEKIVKILYNIDKKIELNNQINDNLHELVKTIYKEWFENEDTLNNGTFDKLGNYIDIERGLSYKGKFLADEGTPMINLGNVMPDGVFRLEKNKYYTGDYKAKETAKVGDIVIANTDMTQDRAVIGTPVIIPPIYDGSIIFSHHIYGVKKIKLPRMYVFYSLLSNRYNNIVAGSATGTTVLALPKEVILNYEILIPSKEKMEQFEKLASTIQQRREQIITENIQLGKLRDTLLPKLMNGEIDLAKIEI